jgi:hypothetical protein
MLNASSGDNCVRRSNRSSWKPLSSLIVAEEDFDGKPAITCTTSVSLIVQDSSQFSPWVLVCVSISEPWGHDLPQTLNRSGRLLNCFISSSVRDQPSSWKLPSIRDAVTDFGMTDVSCTAIVRPVTLTKASFRSGYAPFGGPTSTSKLSATTLQVLRGADLQNLRCRLPFRVSDFL